MKTLDIYLYALFISGVIQQTLYDSQLFPVEVSLPRLGYFKATYYPYIEVLHLNLDKSQNSLAKNMALIYDKNICTIDEKYVKVTENAIIQQEILSLYRENNILYMLDQKLQISTFTIGSDFLLYPNFDNIEVPAILIPNNATFSQGYIVCPDENKCLIFSKHWKQDVIFGMKFDKDTRNYSIINEIQPRKELLQVISSSSKDLIFVVAGTEGVDVYATDSTGSLQFKCNIGEKQLKISFLEEQDQGFYILQMELYASSEEEDIITLFFLQQKKGIKIVKFNVKSFSLIGDINTIDLTNPVKIALLNDTILYAVTKESSGDQYQIHELLKHSSTEISYFYNYARKSEFPVNEIFINDFYTIVLGDDINYIFANQINHNNFIYYTNTKFEQTFPSQFYKHIIKLNSHNLSDPENYKQHYYDYYLAYSNNFYTTIQFENVNAQLTCQIPENAPVGKYNFDLTIYATFCDAKTEAQDNNTLSECSYTQQILLEVYERLPGKKQKTLLIVLLSAGGFILISAIIAIIFIRRYYLRKKSMLETEQKEIQSKYQQLDEKDLDHTPQKL